MTISESPLALGETPIFQGLSQDEAASLADRVQLKRYPLGVDLIRAGHASPGLYVIRSGLVAAVVPDASGVEREVSTLGKGECVGEMSLMTGEPCSTSVRTIVETEAWLLEPADFADLVQGVRAIEMILANPINKDDITRHKGMKETFEKSLVAVIDIAAGARLTREMIGIKNPGTGIRAARLDEVIGKRTTRRVSADSILMPTDIDWDAGE